MKGLIQKRNSTNFNIVTRVLRHQVTGLPMKILIPKRIRSNVNIVIASSSNRTAHDMTHTKEKPYQFQHCSKSFIQLSLRNKHERARTKEKPFQCKHCSKIFFKVTRLDMEKFHSKEKHYQCKHGKLAGAWFTSSSNRNTHGRCIQKRSPTNANIVRRGFFCFLFFLFWGFLGGSFFVLFFLTLEIK